MAQEPFVRIGTHDCNFHTDEVLAIAILTTIYPHHQIVRSRDSDILDMMDILVDVGDRYDHRVGRYDHHQHHPPTDRLGHVLSSAGLIWRHYAKTYLNAIGIPKEFVHKGVVTDLISAVEKNIRVLWIYPIDRGDNGVAQGPTPISEVVRSMRPTFHDRTRARFDAQFLEAVSMVSYLFKRSCFHSADYIIMKVECTNEERIYLNDGRIVISQQPLHNYKMFYSTPAHFVICPVKECKDADPHFVIRPIVDPETKMFKTFFPERVLGTRKEVISQILPVEGISYIHHGGFLALADSQDAAIALCELLLNKS